MGIWYYTLRKAAPIRMWIDGEKRKVYRMKWICRESGLERRGITDPPTPAEIQLRLCRERWENTALADLPEYVVLDHDMRDRGLNESPVLRVTTKLDPVWLDCDDRPGVCVGTAVRVGRRYKLRTGKDERIEACKYCPKVSCERRRSER